VEEAETVEIAQSAGLLSRSLNRTCSTWASSRHSSSSVSQTEQPHFLYLHSFVFNICVLSRTAHSKPASTSAADSIPPEKGNLILQQHPNKPENIE